MGVWGGGSEQRNGGDAGSGARGRNADPRGVEAEEDNPLLQLGCGGGGVDWVDRVGGAARGPAKECSGLLQYGCGGERSGLWSVGGAVAEEFHARGGEGGAQPHGRYGLPGVASEPARVE